MDKKEVIKKVLIGVACVFLLSTCISNCSKQNTIREKNTVIELMDSSIIKLSDSICILNDSIKNLNTRNNLLKESNGLLNKNNKDLNKALQRKVVVNITTNNDEK